MSRLDHFRIKAIGVSNFTVRQLRQLLEVADIKPMVNQVRLIRRSSCMSDEYSCLNSG